ncbi:MAG: N-acetylmuramoyl-L-alanine amidase [Zhaonellaceae bacterium]|jgi:N-acetylmuramoyl-L-alanine amidase|nr:N-acetylmuramoyl-L-alanine amidase [Clostridia bacterium]
MKLCIDAGHGGNDPGTSAAGIQEKDLTLSISLYMAKRAQELGFEVFLTRDEDKGLTSTARSNIVMNSGAKICLSNHINAGKGTGAEVIHSLHSDGKLAKAILESIKSTRMPVRRVFSKESTTQPGKDYYFMHRLTYPVVPETLIIEYGFIDNPSDRARLADPEMQKQLVEAVLKAVCVHVGMPYLAPNTIVQPNWKEQIMQEAIELGLIEAGKHQADEHASKWFVCAVVMNALKKLN